MFFCTLFDSYYIHNGIALYESLYNHCDKFHLFIFAFDDKCYNILKELNTAHATIVHLKELEDEELLTVKPTRTNGEYCWTCIPSVIKFVLDNYNVESCTYLDSDIYFWDSPDKLFEELNENSVLIVSHRYTQCYDQSKKSGEYNSQFITFKNSQNGRLVLEWWRGACNEWCYARHEDGKFADQKYLDDWPQRFKGIHVLNHLGGGVAPWNIQQYKIFKRGDALFGREVNTGNEFQIVFYHFHNLRFYTDEVDLGGYRLSKEVKQLIYTPYIIHLERIRQKLEAIDESEKAHALSEHTISNSRMFLQYIKHALMLNIINYKHIKGDSNVQK